MKDFWSRVDKSDPSGCWVWLAGKNSDGYGEFWEDGEIWYAHRYSWVIHNGAIPDKMWVLHHCDNPSCVNPKHLFLGTQLDNLADMHRKGRGRGPRGNKNPSSKLRPEDIPEIRKMFDHGVSRAEIARKYGVAWHSINRILSGKRWTYL